MQIRIMAGYYVEGDAHSSLFQTICPFGCSVSEKEVEEVRKSIVLN